MTLAMKEDVNQFKRERILGAAAELFFERGYTATTTEALTDKLSISKTMIYQHFRSKLDMLCIICERAVSAAVEIASESAKHPGTADERLRRLVYEFTLVVIEHHKWIAISQRELHTLPAETQRQIIGMQKEFDRLLRSIIEDGVKSGVFTVDDPAVIALAIGGMIIWVHTWYRPNGRLAPEEIARNWAESAVRMAMPSALPAM